MRIVESGNVVAIEKRKARSIKTNKAIECAEPKITVCRLRDGRHGILRQAVRRGPGVDRVMRDGKFRGGGKSRQAAGPTEEKEPCSPSGATAGIRTLKPIESHGRGLCASLVNSTGTTSAKLPTATQANDGLKALPKICANFLTAVLSSLAFPSSG